MKKHNKKTEAFKLRHSGKSLKEIRAALGIPKSTLSGWFKGDPKAELVKQRLASKANKLSAVRMKNIIEKRKVEWQKTYLNAEVEAAKSFDRNCKDPEFLAGLVGYWGEGDNKQGRVLRVANSDAAFLKMFFAFLKRFLPEAAARAKMHLILYKDLDEGTCKSFWAQAVGIPLEHFIGSSYIGGRAPAKRLKHGIGNLYVTSKEHKVIMLTWIRLLREKIEHAGIV